MLNMFDVFFINLGEAWGKHVRETCNEKSVL